MCGIAGYIGQTNLSQDSVEKTLSIMKNRGPNCQKFIKDRFEQNEVILLHSRLSIIDISSGRQPMKGEDGNFIVFNGEIYNFESLRMELKEKGYLFKSKSDTEVVLNMYLEYGIDFLSKLNGIFGLAIYDYRVEELFVARDALGVKPVYYYC